MKVQIKAWIFRFVSIALVLGLNLLNVQPAFADTYTLIFDPTGRNPENFQVPAKKVVYLTRAPQADERTATVQDLLTLDNYVIPDEMTVCKTAISASSNVSLAFLARTNPNIISVNAEVISPRSGIQNCQ